MFVVNTFAMHSASTILIRHRKWHPFLIMCFNSYTTCREACTLPQLQNHCYLQKWYWRSVKDTRDWNLQQPLRRFSGGKERILPSCLVWFQHVQNVSVEFSLKLNQAEFVWCTPKRLFGPRGCTIGRALFLTVFLRAVCIPSVAPQFLTNPAWFTVIWTKWRLHGPIGNGFVLSVKHSIPLWNAGKKILLCFFQCFTQLVLFTICSFTSIINKVTHNGDIVIGRRVIIYHFRVNFLNTKP